MKICKVEGCERKHFAKGWCYLHYSRWYHRGDARESDPVQENKSYWFTEMLKSPATDECIEWPFSKTGNGYGAFTVGRKTILAHRHMCKLAHGKPGKKDMQAAHHCGNKTCVNPQHIRWATVAENMQDKRLHDRVPLGERNPMARITEEQAREILKRIANGETQTSIAKSFGYTQAAISAIKTGKNWSHLR